jgi:hypothetical protein
MEGTKRPRQRAPQVLRTFAPTRLQDDLLTAVYDRLLDLGSQRDSAQDEPRGPQLEEVSAEHGWLAGTGGRSG